MDMPSKHLTKEDLHELQMSLFRDSVIIAYCPFIALVSHDTKIGLRCLWL